MKKKIYFKKIHGLGNDFIIIENKQLKENKINLTPQFIQKICDRHFGIGADGLIVIDDSKTADFKYLMFNPDGTQAEMCGNGIRCFYKYLLENGLTNKNNIKVETLIGNLDLNVDNNGYFKVNMGKPSIQPQDIGLNNKPQKGKIKAIDKIFDYFAVSMGNPHCVIFIDKLLSQKELEKYGKAIESNTDYFKNKTNVEFVKIENNRKIQMQVYERGAGITLACGTGACASVVAGIMQGYLEKNKLIDVNLPGGNLKIFWSGDLKDPVFMFGPAETVFEGFYFV